MTKFWTRLSGYRHITWQFFSDRYHHLMARGRLAKNQGVCFCHVTSVYNCCATSSPTEHAKYLPRLTTPVNYQSPGIPPDAFSHLARVYEGLGAGRSGANILSNEVWCALADYVVLNPLFALSVRICLNFLALALRLSWEFVYLQAHVSFS